MEKKIKEIRSEILACALDINSFVADHIEDEDTRKNFMARLKDYATLCEGLLDAEINSKIINELEVWKLLFEDAGVNDLSPSEQIQLKIDELKKQFLSEEDAES